MFLIWWLRATIQNNFNIRHLWINDSKTHIYKISSLGYFCGASYHVLIKQYQICATYAWLWYFCDMIKRMESRIVFVVCNFFWIHALQLMIRWCTLCLFVFVINKQLQQFNLMFIDVKNLKFSKRIVTIHWWVRYFHFL